MLNLMRNSDNDLYLFVIFIYNFFLNIIKKRFFKIKIKVFNKIVSLFFYIH